MPTFCAVRECRTVGGIGIPMYRFPSKFNNNGKISELGCKRLNKWIKAINREDLTESKVKNYRVCGKHFISGKKADLQDLKNPDWVPSLNLGYSLSVSSSDILIEEFCRLCLNTNKNYYSLFETSGAEMLESLTSLRISVDDPAPNVVCGDCFLELEKAYKIQQKFLKTEQFLQKQFTLEYIKEEPMECDDSKCKDGMENYDGENVTSVDIKIEPEDGNTLSESDSLKEIQTALDYNRRADYDPNSTIKCRLCPKKVLVDDYREHRRTHSDGYCHYCGITRKHLNSLRNHVLNEHREPKITCEKCDITFNNKVTYDLHVRRLHTGEASYVCDICGHRFYGGTVSELKKHVQTKHVNLKRFICDVCGKSFVLKDRLDTHKQVHYDKSLFVCEYCGKGFNYKCNMNVHKRSVHGWMEAQTVKCDICGKGFSTQKALVSHLPKHYKNNEFKN